MKIDIGTPVLVTAQGYNYSNQIGVVVDIYGSSCIVVFSNGKSSYKPERLTRVASFSVPEEVVYKIKTTHPRAYNKFRNIVSKKQNVDNKENDKMKLTGFKKIAVITFGGCRGFEYALYDENIKEGDTVVVTGRAEGQLVEIDEVVDVTPTTNTDHITEEVIAKVDTTAYNQRVNNRVRKAELMRQMDKKIAEAKELDKYAEYAKLMGGEMADLFKEFSAL